MDIKDVKFTVEEWRIFYSKNFGIKFDEKEILNKDNLKKEIEKKVCCNNNEIKEELKTFNRLMIIPKGLNNDLVYEVCKKHFQCYRSRKESLSNLSLENNRESNKKKNHFFITGPYTVLISDKAEIYKQFEIFSTEGKDGGTLLERMIFELKLFLSTGIHTKVVSKCLGSYSSSGYNPRAGWDERFKHFHVYTGWHF